MHYYRAIIVIIGILLCSPSTGGALDSIPPLKTEDVGVDVFVEGCTETDIKILKKYLDIETAAFSPGTAAWVYGTRPKVSVICSGDILKIRVDDSNSDQFIERSIDINEAVSLAMHRFVALAVVELLETGGEELQKSRPKISTAMIIEPEEKKPSEPARSLNLTIAPNLWLGGTPMWLSYGGSLGMEFELFEWLVPALDFDMSYGFNDVPMGRIDAFQFSGAGLVLFRLPVTKMYLLFGLGFKIGAVSLKGAPNEGTELAGNKIIFPWHSPCADMRTTFFANDTLQLGLNIQGGWYSFEAHATVNGEREMSLQDGWIHVGFIGKIKVR